MVCGHSFQNVKIPGIPSGQKMILRGLPESHFLFMAPTRCSSQQVLRCESECRNYFHTVLCLRYNPGRQQHRLWPILAPGLRDLPLRNDLHTGNPPPASCLPLFFNCKYSEFAAPLTSTSRTEARMALLDMVTPDTVSTSLVFWCSIAHTGHTTMPTDQF